MFHVVRFSDKYSNESNEFVIQPPPEVNQAILIRVENERVYFTKIAKASASVAPFVNAVATPFFQTLATDLPPLYS